MAGLLVPSGTHSAVMACGGMRLLIATRHNFNAYVGSCLVASQSTQLCYGMHWHAVAHSNQAQCVCLRWLVLCSHPVYTDLLWCVASYCCIWQPGVLPMPTMVHPLQPSCTHSVVVACIGMCSLIYMLPTLARLSMRWHAVAHAARH